MYCRACGHRLMAGDKFCSNCGMAVETISEVKKEGRSQAYSDAMSFSAEDLKKVHEVLEAEKREETLKKNHTIKIPFKKIKNDMVIEDDPDMTIFIPSEELPREDFNEIIEISGSPYKKLFVNIIGIGVFLGIIFGLFATLGLGLL